MNNREMARRIAEVRKSKEDSRNRAEFILRGYLCRPDTTGIPIMPETVRELRGGGWVAMVR